MPSPAPAAAPVRRACRAAAAGLALAALAATPALAREAHFTDQQASDGQAVYKQNCAMCHGTSLQGGAGPALAGDKFSSSLQFSKMSATQLFDFISKHMPKNNPGELGHDKYVQVFAYILSKNGFPAGDTQLDEKELKKVDLLPLPGASGQ